MEFDWTLGYRERMAFLLESGFASDLTLLLSETSSGVIQEVKVHKIILIMNSQVFSEKIMTIPSSSSSETNSTGNQLSFQNVDLQSFLRLLVYLYTGEVNPEYTEVLHLFPLAIEYNIPDLISKCEIVLNNNFCIDKILGIFDKAIISCHEPLKDASLNFICENAMDILESLDFENLNESAVIEIIGKDELEIERELHVFNSIWRWGIAECRRRVLNPEDSSDMGNVLKNVLKLVRFPLMEQSEFALHVSPKGVLPVEHVVQLLVSFSLPIDSRIDFPSGYSNVKRKTPTINKKQSPNSIPNLNKGQGSLMSSQKADLEITQLKQAKDYEILAAKIEEIESVQFPSSPIPRQDKVDAKNVSNMDTIEDRISKKKPIKGKPENLNSSTTSTLRQEKTKVSTLCPDTNKASNTKNPGLTSATPQISAILEVKNEKKELTLNSKPPQRTKDGPLMFDSSKIAGNPYTKKQGAGVYPYVQFGDFGGNGIGQNQSKNQEENSKKKKKGKKKAGKDKNKADDNVQQTLTEDSPMNHAIKNQPQTQNNMAKPMKLNNLSSSNIVVSNYHATKIQTEHMEQYSVKSSYDAIKPENHGAKPLPPNMATPVSQSFNASSTINTSYYPSNYQPQLQNSMATSPPVLSNASSGSTAYYPPYVNPIHGGTGEGQQILYLDRFGMPVYSTGSGGILQTPPLQPTSSSTPGSGNMTTSNSNFRHYRSQFGDVAYGLPQRFDHNLKPPSPHQDQTIGINNSSIKSRSQKKDLKSHEAPQPSGPGNNNGLSMFKGIVNAGTKLAVAPPQQLHSIIAKSINSAMNLL